MNRELFAFLIAALVALTIPARAVQPNEQLSDPKLEARARSISQELRCVICQNQTIDDSDAPIAHDLRVMLRERLLAGDSDEQVKAFLVKRYGNYVLLKPPFEPDTWLLWLGPFALLLLGGAAAAVYVRGRGKLAAVSGSALSADESRRLDDILASKD